MDIDGRNGAEVPVNTVVRFNHMLRLRMETPDRIYANTPMKVRVWFQQYVDGGYEDLTDSAIYDQSTARLTVLSPSANSKPKSVALKNKGDCFTAEVSFKAVGVWLAEVRVQNDYMSERANDLSFEVLPVPTPEPTLAPTEAPTRADADTSGETVNADGSMTLESESGDFAWQVKAGDEAGELVVSWTGDVGTDAEAELRAADSGATVFSGIHPGDKIDLSALDPDVSYTLLLNAFTDPDADASQAPPIQALDLRLVPDADQAAQAVVDLIDTMVKLTPMLMDSDNVAAAGQMAAQLASDVEGGVDALADQLAGTAEEGAAGQDTASSGSGGGAYLTMDGSGGSNPTEKPAERTIARPVVKPTPEPTVEPTVAPTPEPTPEPSILDGVTDFLKHRWIYLVCGVAALVLLVLVALFVAGRGGRKVTGNMRVICEEIDLEMLLYFEGNKRVKEHSPITQHPDVAKLKGGKVYDVLSHLSVSMAQADGRGEVKGSTSEVAHMPNEKLIAVTCVDPRNGKKQVAYVGRGDLGEEKLNVYDAGKTYAVTLSGNLSMEELLHLKN